YNGDNPHSICVQSPSDGNIDGVLFLSLYLHFYLMRPCAGKEREVLHLFYDEKNDGVSVLSVETSG
ncbi:hypothetical protein RZO55_12370, partial [Clostridium boliviensis]